ncbi:hypothetical protein Pint_24293 [Pistacia integerrima]|uniref:Uncharacterized protein n=1 Tax=Pistacia integerrima TaxID=434235 RepID=A0ACC0YGX7_9ROSI|nr:hypothetical protein Pint_24293 [Pistacia integerrima]
MDSLLHTTSATSLASKLLKLSVHKQSNSFLTFARKSVIVSAKKSSKKNTNKEDTHSFFAKPEEDSLFFPEAVLLKEKKVQEDGRVLPEFADAEEEELYEFLNLQLQSEVSVDRMRHYEVVYLIHEKHAEEVGSVNEKVQDFLREKKGKVWRFNDWGLRRLAYKIQKAKNAHYILMNFELEAKYINEFKTMLDKDERVIRHLVIKRDNAITKDCPPPPEFHTLRADMQGYDDDDEDSDYDDAYDDEDFDDTWDGEGEEMDGYDDVEDGVVIVNVDDIKNKRTINHLMQVP